MRASIQSENYTTPEVTYEPGERPPGSFDSAKADAVIESAMTQIPSARDDEPKSERKDLDSIISENLDKHYAAQEEQKEWTKSQDSRAELNHRYGEHGDFGKTLDAFIDAHRQFKADPQGTGLKFVESYLRASPYGLSPREKKERPKRTSIRRQVIATPPELS